MIKEEIKEKFKNEANHLTSKQQDEAMKIMDNFLRSAIRDYITTKTENRVQNCCR